MALLKWFGQYKTIAGKLAITSVLFIFTVWTVFPILWLVRTSLVPAAQSEGLPPDWVSGLNLANYRELLGPAGYGTPLLHSMFASLAVTALATICGTSAAYALVHLRRTVRATGRFEFWVISSRFAPSFAVGIPYYYIYRTIHLEDTLYGVVLAELVGVVGIVTWIMITSFKAIPSILLEAGQVDGCSALTNLLRVALPLVTPGLVGAATVAFLFSWNEFFLALLLTNTSAVTAPVALYQLIGNLQLNIGELAAGGCIVVAPTVLVVAFFQKQLIEGLTLGSVQE